MTTPHSIQHRRQDQHDDERHALRDDERGAPHADELDQPFLIEERLDRSAGRNPTHPDDPWAHDRPPAVYGMPEREEARDA